MEVVIGKSMENMKEGEKHSDETDEGLVCNEKELIEQIESLKRKKWFNRSDEGWKTMVSDLNKI